MAGAPGGSDWRRVAFVGALNFRDLGGYPTTSGRRTRSGVLFRSDSLHKLTTEDLAVFDGFGIRAVYDLRRRDECERDPGPRGCIHPELPSHHVAAGDVSALRSRDDGERWLLTEYWWILTHGAAAFGRLFTALAQAAPDPQVFHCIGGKDRTGLAAALLLTCLGVDRETVLDDYELTGRYVPPEQVPHVVDLFVGYGIARPAAEGMLGSPRWVMAETLAALDRTHGGVDSYLHESAADMAPAVVDLLRSRLTG